ncbi:MAG: DUF1800 family protein [Rhodospirillales bacterium]
MVSRLFMIAVAAGVLSPGAAVALPLEDARHLAGRVAFGLDPAIRAPLIAGDRVKAVDALFATVRTAPVTSLPEWTTGSRDPGYVNTGRLNVDERKAFDDRVRIRREELRAWWMKEMLDTPSPFTERMVLFWHGHFTSSLDPVNHPDLLLQQNLLLRRHAFGDFRQMVREITRDPAMIRYLDLQQNRKGAPNENYARELFELFTLGEGHYSEADIREAARALTGLTVDPTTRVAGFDARRFDDGEKTIFGKTAKFGIDELIDHTLAQPRAAVFVVEKLWREFVSDRPDPAVVARLSERFRADWNLAGLVRGLLTTDAFWASANRAVLVKSPVDVLVGTARLTGAAVQPDQLWRQSARLGLDLFNPPNVKGWPGGAAWINADTILRRRQMAQALARNAAEAPEPWNVPGGPTALLLAAPPQTTPPETAPRRRRLVGRVGDTAYQLQ